MTESEVADKKIEEAMQQVMDRANELGLHGIIILSPACEECGGLHDFAMIADMKEIRHMVSLLKEQLEVIGATTEPELLRRHPKRTENMQ